MLGQSVDLEIFLFYVYAFLKKFVLLSLHDFVMIVKFTLGILHWYHNMILASCGVAIKIMEDLGMSAL